MKYRYEASSAEAVVQLIAASYLRHGYYWYITGQIPDRKSPAAVDQKLIDKYGIDVTEWQRARRRQQGLANAQYLRFGHWFIFLLTDGNHALRAPASKGGEGEKIQDFRRIPLRFHGYSISYRQSGVARTGGGATKWHAHVRIDGDTYAALKAHFNQLAVHRNAEQLALEFASIPFGRYAPVRRQLLNLLRSTNKRRESHAYELLPFSVLNMRRVPQKAYRETEQVPSSEGSPATSWSQSA